MVYLAVMVEDDEKAIDFMLKTQKRLEEGNLVKNPFTGKIKNVDRGGGYLSYIVIINPIYPKFYYAGIFAILVTSVFTGIRLSWWLTPGVLLLSTRIYWSPMLYLLMLKIGIRKAGYKGKVKTIQINDLLLKIL